LRPLSSWLEARGSWLAASSGLVAWSLQLEASSGLAALEDRTMCRKAVWLIGALMGLVWLGGVAVAWLPGTPKLRLSVAAGALGVVPGHGRHGTDETHGTGADPITRHASRVRAGGKVRVLAGARWGPVHCPERMAIDVSGGSAPGSPLFSLKRGESRVRRGLMARGAAFARGRAGRSGLVRNLRPRCCVE